MSRLRYNTTSVTGRVRALNDARRRGIEPVNAFGRDCVDTALGQRLGIAAIYGGQGEADTARAAALLACADLEDTPDNRAAVLQDLDEIFRHVRVVVTGGPN